MSTYLNNLCAICFGQAESDRVWAEKMRGLPTKEVEEMSTVRTSHYRRLIVRVSVSSFDDPSIDDMLYAQAMKVRLQYHTEATSVHLTRRTNLTDNNSKAKRPYVVYGYFDVEHL